MQKEVNERLCPTRVQNTEEWTLCEQNDLMLLIAFYRLRNEFRLGTFVNLRVSQSQILSINWLHPFSEPKKLIVIAAQKNNYHAKGSVNMSLSKKNYKIITTQTIST